MIETESKTLILGCKNSIIPADGTVTAIGDYAFCDCTGLTSITIPNSVTTIGNRVFYYCAGLTRIDFSGTVEQWAKISKDTNWDHSTGDYTIYCTDGTITKDGTVTYYE